MGGVAKQRQAKTSRRWAHGWFWLASLVLLGGMSAVLAQTAQEVKELLEWGDHEVALERAEEGLEKRPGDVELRFYRALALARTGEVDEALDAFEELAEEYPQSPQIHNNIAVLYARQGEYDKARASLEAALNTNDIYSTAHKNLADIYSAQAAAAYNRALARDEARDVPKPRLALLGDWALPVEEDEAVATPKAATKAPAKKAGGTASGKLKTQALPEPAELAEKTQQAKAESEEQQAASGPEQAEPAAPAEAKVENKVAAKQDQPGEQARPEAEEQQAESTIKSKPIPATAPAKAQKTAAAEKVADTNKASKPETPVIAPKQARQAAQAVEDWADAWREQNVAGYLSAYADFFRPEEGLSHQAWREQRRDRVSSPEFIRLGIADMRIRLKDKGRAIATFQQDYQSDSYQDSVRKTLYLEEIEGVWKIVREVSE